MSTIVICSGGLDSVTLAWKIQKELNLKLLISFDYGQRHVKELDFAAICANTLDVELQVIDLTSVGRSLTGSALTDGIPVPDGHYAKSNMTSTIVPNRNAIMLSVAYGVAAARKLKKVATAVQGGDQFI